MKTKASLWKTLALAMLGSVALIVTREAVQAHENGKPDSGAIELWLPSIGIVYGESLRTTMTNFGEQPVAVRPVVVNADGVVVKEVAEPLVVNPGQMRAFLVSRSEVGGGGPAAANGADQSVILRPAMSLRKDDAKKMKVTVEVIDEANGRTRIQTAGGCPDWMCGSNHNETLVRDQASME